MKKLIFIFGLFLLSQNIEAQTFGFECFCGYLTKADTTCDICTPTLQARFFEGLLIRQSGKVKFWIDAPYTVKVSGNNLTFQELIDKPDPPVTIALSGTSYPNLTAYKNAVKCRCEHGSNYVAGPGIIISGDTISAVDKDSTNELQVLTVRNDSVFLSHNGGFFVIAGSGGNTVSTTGNVITINGSGGGLLPLPYFTGDTAALSGGLSPGDPYLLACNNDYDLPAGIFKVIKICAYDCTVLLNYYSNDAQAILGVVPVNKEYVLDEFNIYGILYGFIKVVTGSDTGSLSCNTEQSNYNNDASAISGGKTYGDHYLMSVSNTYGSPNRVERVVSQTTSTTADAQICCDEGNLPYYNNDSDAISNGTLSGYYYYLKASNTYGFPHGTKKRVL